MVEISEMELFFPFKGERNYVHGTDIYNKLKDITLSFNPKKMDVRFNGMSKKSLIVKKNADISLAKVNFSFESSGVEYRYSLIEGSTDIIAKSIYDENVILRLSALNLERKEVCQQSNSGYTFIENVVALNKYLLSSILTEKKGKWLFTRIEIERFADESSLVVIKLVKNFNYRIVKSDIYVDNDCIGSIYFSLA